jgi:hypothetical protein
MTERFLAGSDQQRPTHVVHLGDTYYAGTPNEQYRNLLAPWPVTPWDASKSASWALNGNHDMFSGGHGLFETTLRDPRFALQWAGGRPTSWMLLRGDKWNVLGLDTAWNDKPIDIGADGKLRFEGALGHLTDYQHETIKQIAAEDKKLLILSHHQAFVAYGGPVPTPLGVEIEGLLGGRTVEAWFWGHEHDCIAYDEHAGIRAARSIGHGAVPEVIRTDEAGSLNEDGTLVKPVASDDMPDEQPRRAVKWEYRGYRIGEDDQHWMKHGFSVVDVNDDALSVRYIDDEGVDIVEPETLT